MTILLSIILIIFAAKELLFSYRYRQRKQTLNLLLNGENNKIEVTTEKNKNIAFEKIVAQNSLSVDFLRRFQEEYLWKIYSVIILFAVLFVINNFFDIIALSQETIVILIFGIITVIIFAPAKIVRIHANKKIKGISRDLPLIIDIMAIMIKSGMTLENSFMYLSSKVKEINPDVAAIFERSCILMKVNGIEAAVDLIYREVPSKEIRMFCITLKRSINHGNSIYDVLLDLSTEMREIQKLTIEEKIAAISAKMTIPMMLFILFPVLVIIGGPIVMRLLSMF
ncbi:type II secretion system F family protein [Orbus wheelerorum]|uniref:type II secretion system F family protein n=1 Tax=Orbus wheelerorum TaxID=3074111 RepID=UPI00370D1395